MSSDQRRRTWKELDSKQRTIFFLKYVPCSVWNTLTLKLVYCYADPCLTGYPCFLRQAWLEGQALARHRGIWYFQPGTLESEAERIL